jgi:hypothetical protein
MGKELVNGPIRITYSRVFKTREIGITSLLRNQWDRELDKVNISLQLNTLTYSMIARVKTWRTFVMLNTLVQKLKLTPQDKSDLDKFVGQLKSIAEFFSDAIEAVKDTAVVDAIAGAAPWVDAVGGAFAEAVPPVKFLVELFARLTKEHDPEALGFLACTLAYERSVEEAIKSLGSPEAPRQVREAVKERLSALEPSEDVTFKHFSFADATAHEFVRKADDALREYASAVGYTEPQRRQLVNKVHMRFVANLKSILSHGKLKERFAPFTQLMDFGTEEQQAYDALLEHMEYQRWLFAEAPVFGNESFALAHIYVNTECGKLAWGHIQESARRAAQGHMRERVDPFSEQWGGRQDLTETVLNLIGDPGFREAIVIQGVAGSGKSSFTLKLCSTLLQEGLLPIRVRLRDLQLDRHVSEALPKALFPVDKNFGPEGRAHRGSNDPFLNGKIFEEEAGFRGASICPYVLILDGWDEISISATEGFKVRVAKMLEEIRSEYLRNRRIPIRVILTGRPSEAVSDSKFLREDTPLLTIRPIRPDQLRKFVADLSSALEMRPIEVDQEHDQRWTIPDMKQFEAVFDRYQEDFAASLQPAGDTDTPPQRVTSFMPSGSLAVLGLPLLAHLAVRLISGWPGDRAALIASPTTLYRCLVDLTCAKGGKPPEDESEIEAQLRIAGTELRELLRRTAVAMTIYGKESISYTELSLRLGLEADELDRKAIDAETDHVLTSLMISFFFKGGHTHLGCEFVHKSFREYLFAEAIVETLKEFGRKGHGSLSERQPYWKDFSADDPRFELARCLAELLAPHWLSPETATHLRELIIWEVARAREDRDVPEKDLERLGTRTEPLDLERWGRVRDALADIWDWWAEGVHLRPQPKREPRTRTVSLEGIKTYAQELVELAAPHDPVERSQLLEPSRVVSIDAHLGDGLFRLCALVHYHVAVNSGWIEPGDNEGAPPRPDELWAGVSPIGEGPRRCQSAVRQERGTWILFAPSWNNPVYFFNYTCRINGAGWRPLGPFPTGMDLSGIDLRGAGISSPIADPDSPSPPPTVWRRANLSEAFSIGGVFDNSDFSEVFAKAVRFLLIACAEVNFTNAFLAESQILSSQLREANLSSANLRGTDLTNTSLEKANLSGSVLIEAKLKDANLTDANLDGADMTDAELRNTRGIPSHLLSQILKKLN